jgi:AraC-like DNA-binding protein
LALAESIRFDPLLESFLGSAERHVDVSIAADAGPPSSESAAYFGAKVSLLQVRLSSISRLLVRNPPDSLVVAIPDVGQCTGSAAKRDLRFVPGRLSFILLPGEVLKLTPKSNYVSGFLFKLSAQDIVSESITHGVSEPSLMSLADTLPGHESLLLACAKQMIVPDASALVVEPLEASVFSLLASLLAAEQKSVPSSLINASTHSRYVQIALSYMEERLAEPITLRDLCNTCCVSARTLQISFQSVMNRPPLQVLHELRLTRLRELLLCGAKVATACKSVGLSPSGRLSASYQSMFGELPRQTRSGN